MIPPRLLFDAQLCNTITPTSRVSAFHSYDRSCETRESRGRARLPVTARCYSILELGLRFSIPFLATFSLKFESLSKSGGSMRRKRRIIVDRESGLFKSGSRKSYFNQVLTGGDGGDIEAFRSWTARQLDSLFRSLSVSCDYDRFEIMCRAGEEAAFVSEQMVDVERSRGARLEGILTFSSEIVAV